MRKIKKCIWNTKLIVCQCCGKSPVTGFNRPHSQHRTKKIIKPNLQKYHGQIICSRCLRTITRS